MKIIIIENETYLAESMAIKVSHHGFEVEIFHSSKGLIEENSGDIYLLSTNIPSKSLDMIIKKLKNKILILMLNYQCNNLLKKYFSLGINDYIMKPFHFNELISKIKHHQEFINLSTSIATYKSYLSHSFRDNIKIQEDINMTFPLIIESDASNYVDKWVFKYYEKYNRLFTFIPLMQDSWKKKIKATKDSDFLYLKNEKHLTKKKTEELFQLLEGKNFILSTSTTIESEYKTLKVSLESTNYQGYEIMTIEKYIQFIILKYQYSHPDTVISKKLGFSRKALRERRIKYDIHKVKNLNIKRMKNA